MLVTTIIHTAFLLSAHALPNVPELIVTSDDTIITQSCRVVIPSGTVIKDSNGNGVIQIGASNIKIEFAPGSVLRGSPQSSS
ncbi:MAG: hypothetical protein HQ515_04545, partial [Phycisphaeraceae bacterium]|nr:hypothetical protein [Phycisphaeraceae bacterium]